MEIESGKILLEKSIQHLDDITSLITFIKEKMDSWRRLKVILIGKKKEVFKRAHIVTQGLRDNSSLSFIYVNLNIQREA